MSHASHQRCPPNRCKASTTSFNTAGDGYDQGVFSRTVRITHPDGTQEFYGQQNTYGGSTWPDFAGSQIPTNTPVGTLDTTERQERNTFYWNAQQFAPYVSTSVYDFDWDAFKKSRVRHWLAATEPTYTHWGSLSLEQAPSPDGTTEGQITWYDYTGKPTGVTYEVGTQVMPSVVAQVMPDGSTKYNYMRYSPVGQATNVVEKWVSGGADNFRTNRFIYDTNGVDMKLHIGVENEQVVSNYFNANHQVLASYDALNQESKYTYDGTTRLLTSATRPGGLVTTNIYFTSGAAANRLDKTIDLQISRTNSYTWGADGNVFSHTDERGLTTTNYWDGLNRLTGTKYPDGTTTTNLFTIDSAYPSSSGGLNILETTATKDRLGFWTYVGYDSMRRKIAVTNANNVVTRFGFCDCGAVSSVTNAWNTPAQMVTTYAYDFQGHAVNTYLPDMTITNWFDSLGRNIASADGWGSKWIGYDNLNRLISVTNGLSAMEQLTVYDIDDHPIYVTDANGVTITNTYDLLGRLSTRTYPDNGVEKFGYSARGLTAYTNQLNFETYYVYDEASRKMFETNANNEVIRYTNNAAGDLLALVDGKNQVTKWNYDEFGRVTNKLDQLNVEILRYKYDPDSRLTNRWSNAKGDTKYAYDDVGNLTNINYAVSTDVRFQYDPMNRVTNMVDAVGTTKYTYTIAGRLFTEDGPWSNDTVTNFYNNGLRTNLSLAQATGSWTNGFGYDAAKRLTSVSSKAGTFSYTLGAAGAASPLIKKISLPNTSYITNAYDGNARLLFTKLNTSGHTNLDAVAYGYNAGNQRVTATNTPGSRYNYTNDPIGQLTVADSSSNSEDRGYTYDTAWNLNYRTNNGTLQTFTVDGLNQLTNAIGNTCKYDANGNLTNNAGITYTYDDENQLTFVSDEVNHTYRYGYVYDGRGRLKYRQNYAWVYIGLPGYVWQPTDSLRYIYDGMRVIQERISDSPMVSYTRGTDLSGSLEGAGGIGGLLARSHDYMSTNGNWYTHNFYHADGNGNITYMVNSGQTLAAYYRYDAYGNELNNSGTLGTANTYRFSSKQKDVNTGLYYYGYRWYAPNHQRWLNRDPIFERGGINLYGFVQNMPIQLVDYMGLAQICVDCSCNGADLSGFTYLSESEPPNDGPKVPRELPKPGECVSADAVYEPGKATKTGDIGSGTISCSGGKPKFKYNPGPKWFPKNGDDGNVWPFGEPMPPKPPGWPDNIPPYSDRSPKPPLPPLNPRPEPTLPPTWPDNALP